MLAESQSKPSGGADIVELRPPSSLPECPVQSLRHGHWSAQLALEFAVAKNQRGQNCFLKRCRHQGPLYVQKPFYPEGPELAHIYLLHPPGGVVSGDVLQVQLDLQPHSKVLCTSPGAARFYAARADNAGEPREQSLQQHFRVAKAASLEWLPMETLIYSAAEARVATVVTLDNEASFCGWEFTVLGLPASKQPFLSGSAIQKLSVYRDGKPLFIDRMTLDATSPVLRAAAGMAGKTVFGCFTLVPPLSKQSELGAWAEAVRGLIDELPDGHLLALSQQPELLLLRYLGDSANQGRELFAQCWSVVRPLMMAREACPPRIWRT